MLLLLQCLCRVTDSSCIVVGHSTLCLSSGNTLQTLRPCCSSPAATTQASLPNPAGVQQAVKALVPAAVALLRNESAAA